MFFVFVNGFSFVFCDFIFMFISIYVCIYICICIYMYASPSFCWIVSCLSVYKNSINAGGNSVMASSFIFFLCVCVCNVCMCVCLLVHVCIVARSQHWFLRGTHSRSPENQESLCPPHALASSTQYGVADAHVHARLSSSSRVWAQDLMFSEQGLPARILIILSPAGRYLCSCCRMYVYVCVSCHYSASIEIPSQSSVDL